MKTLRSIIYLALLVLWAPACTQFLDIPKEDTLNPDDDPFSDPTYIDAFVGGVYADAAGAFTNWGMYGVLNMRGDDYLKGGRDGDQPDLELIDEFDYSTLSSSWISSQGWDAMNNFIRKSNDNLKGISDLLSLHSDDEDAIAKAKLGRAEIRVLRAYAYFLLVNLYDGVPLITDKTDITVWYPRTKPEGILQFIIDEMDDVADDLPNVRPNERSDRYGAVTRATALAVKAKAALYLKDYATVLAATEPIINSGRFNLYPQFYDMFKIKAKVSDESILEMQFTDFGQGSGDIVKPGNWFDFQGPNNKDLKYDTDGKVIMTTDTIDGVIVSRPDLDGQGNKLGLNGWAFMSQEPSFITFMKERGETDRLEGTVLGQGATRDGDTIASLPSGYPQTYNYKAYTPTNEVTDGRTGYGDGNNVRMLRYADVLLMQAEAKIMLGQSGDDEINEVRSRSNMTSISGATIDDLLDERLAEFAGEWGFRFWDLVRNDKAVEKLGGKGYKKGEHEYLPIPQTQIDLNPLLIQEPIDYIPED
ncbi:MAG: RagB/SusD family nutrient uptake outer membrane protein [Mangrovibacterium sp.]